MSDDFDIVQGDVRIRVEGLGKALRAMSKAGADAEDMKNLMFDIGSLVVQAANPPSLTGNLGSTLRAGRGKTKAVVRAGGARAPYAGVIEYGWPAHNIAPNGFLAEALTSTRAQILDKLDKGLADLLTRNGL